MAAVIFVSYVIDAASWLRRHALEISYWALGLGFWVFIVLAATVSPWYWAAAGASWVAYLPIFVRRRNRELNRILGQIATVAAPPPVPIDPMCRCGFRVSQHPIAGCWPTIWPEAPRP